MIKRFGDWVIVGKYWVNEKTGQRVPVIQGAGPAVTVQNDRYAFGDDDGNEAGHSLDTQNTNRTAQAADETFLIRIEVQETNGGTENLTAALYAQKNGTGGFIAVPFSATNNGLRLADDTQSRADDENTSNRLTGGSGTFTAGKYDDGTSAVGTGNVTLDNDTAGRTEFEFAIQIDSANASDSDYWELRVEQLGGTDLDGYPGSYPTVTASILSTPQASVSDGISTLGDTAAAEITNLGDIAVTDGIATVADTPTLSVSGGAPEVNVSDTVQAQDAAQAETDAMQVAVSDGIAALGESSPAALAALETNQSEGFTLGESADADITLLEIVTSDGVTIADALPGYYFDNVILGESISASVTGEAAFRDVDVSDTIQAQDSAAAALDDLETAQSEGITLGEAASAALADLESAQSDDITLDESSTLLIGLETNQSEGVTIGEADNENIGIATSHADNITLDESSTLLIGLETAQDEDVTIADAATLATDAMLVNVSDNISTVEDSASVEIGALVPQDISAADNVTIADAVNLNIGLETSQAEGVTLGEADAEEIELDISVQDDITAIGDDASANVTTISPLSIPESENLTLGEALSVNLSALEGSATDTVQAQDSTTVSISAVGEISLSVSDDIDIADAASVENTDLYAVLSENLTIGEVDGEDLQLEATQSDGLTLGENVSIANAAAIASVSDGLTLADQLFASLPDALEIAASDNLTLDESIALIVTLFSGVSLSVSDGITVGDTASLELGRLEYPGGSLQAIVLPKRQRQIRPVDLNYKRRLGRR